MSICYERFAQAYHSIILNFQQELDLRLFCVKGIGRDHAKFSPVGKLLKQSTCLMYDRKLLIPKPSLPAFIFWLIGKQYFSISF